MAANFLLWTLKMLILVFFAVFVYLVEMTPIKHIVEKMGPAWESDDD